jgi:hypothetical protein
LVRGLVAHYNGYKVTLALGVALAIGGAVASYVALGGVGVALLGVGIIFVAVRVELEEDVPVGSDTNEGLFASTVAARDADKGRSRAALADDRSRAFRLGTWAQIIGGVMAAIGLALILLSE